MASATESSDATEREAARGWLVRKHASDRAKTHLMVAEGVELLTRLVRAIVDESDAVVVTYRNARGGPSPDVHVAPGTNGQLIGNEGRNITALRRIIGACAAKHRRRLEIRRIEPPGRETSSRRARGPRG